MEPIPERIIGSTTTSTSPSVPAWQFDLYVSDEADGIATPDQVAVLEADRGTWRARLRHLLLDIDDASVPPGTSRATRATRSWSDLRSEQRGLEDAWHRLTGETPIEDESKDAEQDADAEEPRTTASPASCACSSRGSRAASWPGRAGPQVDPAPPPRSPRCSPRPARRRRAGPARARSPCPTAATPRRSPSPWATCSAGSWRSAPATGDDVGPSVRWLGRRRHLGGRADRARLGRPARSASASAATPAATARRRLLLGPLDAGAGRPRPARRPGRRHARRGRSPSTPSVDARVGRPLRAHRHGRRHLPRRGPARRGARAAARDPHRRRRGRGLPRPGSTAAVRRARPASAASSSAPLEQWARPGHRRPTPASSCSSTRPTAAAPGTCSVLAPGRRTARLARVGRGRHRQRRAPGPRRSRTQLTRLERLLPVLHRPGGNRRGEVVLSQDEAWELMTETGPRSRPPASTCGCPALSRKKATPSLRLSADASAPVGRRRPPARQRALVGAVRRRRADRRRHRPPGPRGPAAGPVAAAAGSSSTRPTSRRPPPRWPSASRPPSSPAPRCCATPSASRARRSPAASSLERRAWAADLLPPGRRPLAPSPPPQPEGFVGELRSYQAEALAWLGFLDSAGLGGCLALDMGLGKTPTMLAHLAGRPPASGPALVIAPPAVVGNWAAEAARFTPELRVVVHHGASRRLGRRARRRGRRRRRRHHHLRHRRPRRRGARGARVGPARPRRGPGHQEPGQRHRPAAAPHPRPHPGRPHRHADRERPRRPVGHPRLHQPRPRRPATAFIAQLSADGEAPRRARARTPCGRSTASSCSAAPRTSRSSPPSCPTASTSSTTAP